MPRERITKPEEFALFRYPNSFRPGAVRGDFAGEKDLNSSLHCAVPPSQVLEQVSWIGETRGAT